MKQCHGLCGTIVDLGERDTFPFKERTFPRAAIQGLGTHFQDQLLDQGTEFTL